MSKTFKIVVADDHPIVRQGLRQLIETDESLSIVAEAGDGETAVRLIETHRPDLAILDIDMSLFGGFDVVRELRRRKIETNVIFFTMLAWEYSYLLPYNHGTINFLIGSGQFANRVIPPINVQLLAIIYFVVITAASYILYAAKKEKG